jgi:hypothetical protein
LCLRRVITVQRECARRGSGEHHIIIDPFQSTTWNGIDVANLDRTGVDSYELREELSEIALRQLLNESAEFDSVFIEGLHTFDQTLVEMYYANRLMKLAGYIIVDDVNWASVSRAISYFVNYPCYKIVGGASALEGRLKNTLAKVLKPIAEAILPRWPYDRYYHPARYPSVLALQKVAEDEPSAAWFRSSGRQRWQTPRCGCCRTPTSIHRSCAGWTKIRNARRIRLAASRHTYAA